MEISYKMSEDTRTADIFKSNKKGGYSNLSYEKVLEYIGIDNRTVFEENNDVPMKEIDNKVIEQISKSLIGLTKAYGMVDEGNEYKRQEFVSTIIFNIVEQYYDKGVKLKREKQIEGEDIKGPVEFVIVRDKLILIAIEAKKQDWDQGRVHILMQLYNTYIKNIKLGAPKNHVMYGIVTAGYTWEFIWCEGNNINDINDIKPNLIWKHEQKFDPIETNLKKKQEQWKDRVAPLVKKIYFMINHSLNQLAENK